jgi:hypothetical protein
MMTTQTATATKLIYLPKRVFHADWETFERTLGVQRTGSVDTHNTCYQVIAPADWTIGDSDVSPWQKRLIDGNGKHLARLFYKPLGGAAMQLMD